MRLSVLAAVVLALPACSAPAPRLVFEDGGPLDAQRLDAAAGDDAAGMDGGELADSAPLDAPEPHDVGVLPDGLVRCRGGERGPVCYCNEITGACPMGRTCCDPIVDSGAPPGFHCILTPLETIGYCEGISVDGGPPLPSCIGGEEGPVCWCGAARFGCPEDAFCCPSSGGPLQCVAGVLRCP